MARTSYLINNTLFSLHRYLSAMCEEKLYKLYIDADSYIIVTFLCVFGQFNDGCTRSLQTQTHTGYSFFHNEFDNLAGYLYDVSTKQQSTLRALRAYNSVAIILEWT